MGTGVFAENIFAECQFAAQIRRNTIVPNYKFSLHNLNILHSFLAVLLLCLAI